LPDALSKYQLILDTLLSEASRDKGTFISLFSTNHEESPDYLISVDIDSIVLISEEIQRKVLDIHDSIYDNLRQKQAHFDSTYKPLSEAQKAAASIAATAIMNAILVPSGMIGVCIIGDQQRPGLTHSDRNALRKAVFRPRIMGEVTVVRKKTDENIWTRKFNMEDAYGQNVDMQEQIDMLLRSVVGSLRFRFKTPFLHDDL
jgi:hypothetical protein